MSWRPSAPAATVAALALLTLSVALPLAAADHAYSHRYIFFGHVVDAENNPVPGIQVEDSYSSVFRPESACANQPGTGTDAWAATATNPITNQYGEFFFCHHVHPMSRAEPGEATFVIEGKEYKFELDAFMRYTFAEIKLDAVHPNANKTLPTSSYTIEGRGWESTGAAEHQVEGIRVFGDTLHNKKVNITFTYNGKPAVSYNTTSNNYGDFAIRAPVTERPTSGTVTVEIDGHTWEAPVTPTGVTSVRAQVGEVARTNVPAPALVAVLGVLGLAAVALRRKD